MALRGKFSQSFLRSKELVSFSEISYDRKGNNILENKILKEALARDSNGNFIRNKANIANILNKYGIVYRMIFNAMNMEQYTYNEIDEALNHLSEYINDLGVSGIIEFHAADKTQNSDHIHFWISSEEKIIYNKIAQEMVLMGYSNKEDVYIQKYEENRLLDEKEYISHTQESNTILNDDFFLRREKELPSKIEFSFRKKYHLIKSTLDKHFKESVVKEKNIIIDTSILDNCSLPKTTEINNILLKIKKLKEKKK